MRKKIKHVSELPNWFKLEKYEFSKELDSAGWYEQFYIRRNFLRSLLHCYRGNKPFPSEFQLAIQSSHENPHIDIFKDQRISNYCHPNSPLHLIKEKNTQQLLGIKSLTMREYICYKFFIRPDRLKYAEDWYDTPYDEKEIYPKDAPWLDEPINNSYQPEVGTLTDTIRITLALPDSLLIENFKQHLAILRKRVTGFNYKHFHKSDFNNWIKFGILPYIDLMIWEHETNARIPNRIMANVLYPLGDKGEETIRKTTNPLMNMLLTERTLHLLTAQAALEIMEKKNK